MTQIIGAVVAPHIEHGILLDLVIPTAVVVENITQIGTVATMTFTNPGFTPFEEGTTLTVSGVTPTSFNGTYTVLACTETQATYTADANTDTYVEGGAAKGKDRRWYISNCYNPIVYNGKTYQALGGFLEITDIQQDLLTTNNEVSLSLSAIPRQYIENIIGQQIKGSAVRIYRVFFDPATKLVKEVGGVRQIFQRFNGIVTNWGLDEQIDNNVTGQAVEIAYTISISCSSLLGVLEHRVSGRRTNNTNYQVYYNEAYITPAITSDLSFSRIEQLKSASFDFGKPVK
jgi:hypothetical protein